MSGSSLPPRPAKRPRTATYSGNRTILGSTPATPASGRWSRVSSTFSDITKTPFGPDATAEEQNGLDHDSAYASKEDSVVEEVEKPKEEGGGQEEGRQEVMTMRRGARRKAPTPKALALKEQPAPARRSRGKTKEAPPAPHNDFDNDENHDENDDNYDRHHSPEPDNTTSRSTRSAKKRRKRRQHPTKSVVFSSSRRSEKQIEQQFGFRDIDPTPTRKARLDAVDEPSAESQGPAHPGNVHNVDNVGAIDSIDNLFVDPDPPLDILSALSLCEATNSTTIPHHSTPDSTSVTAIKHHILQRLTSSSAPARTPSLIPSHLSSAYSTLSALLSSAITASESNSLLLLGARGSGKSLLINTALSSLSRQHANDFHVVRLNGFLQTDDRLALREIWRQLGRERAVDEDETGQVMASYADTMASLLGLLSHPDEVDAGRDRNAMEADDTPLPTTASKSVIIIIDEFDLFATHPRQTLLYNLFDIAQSRKAPIAVIGCSTRMDVIDCLEKRVKSRFSHRWVHVPSAKTLAAFTECVQTVLCVSDDEVVEHVNETDRNQWNNTVTNDLMAQPHVQALLARTFYSTKSPVDVLTKLYLPIATLSLHSSPPTSLPITTSNPSHHPPSLLSLLPTLPPLHLALLIAASRLDSLYLAPAVNFNAVFAHFSLLHRHTRSKLASASSSLRLWSKATCKSAWEDLLRWKFLVVVGGGGAGESQILQT
ncbi:hypothetical protein DV737_g2828, partial [Chaetothyriales sp. CBS 132003]